MLTEEKMEIGKMSIIKDVYGDFLDVRSDEGDVHRE